VAPALEFAAPVAAGADPLGGVAAGGVWIPVFSSTLSSSVPVGEARYSRPTVQAWAQKGRVVGAVVSHQERR
jgi:hypothetical protein